MQNLHIKTILLVFGGESPEHEISLISAANVRAAIGTQHTVICCYIDPEGQWWHVAKVEKKKSSSQPIMPQPGKSAVYIGNQSFAIDVIFPVLHGQNGEDGTIQGLAQMMHTPIVGCGITGSAICIDKVLTKQLLEQAGLPVVPYVVCSKTEQRPAYDALSKKLSTELFIKPARLGSSIGVSKARSAHELTAALDQAFQYDTKVLIEPTLQVREIEVAVLGSNDAPQASVAGEIVPDRDFYSFESKYDSDSTTALQIPAKISETQQRQIRSLAAQAFTVLHCQGLARVDFFMSAANGDLYINEVNTLPGFTSISMYPKLWEATGLTQPALIEELLMLA